MTQSSKKNAAAQKSKAPVSPDALLDFRAQLTRGEGIVDPKTWAGSIPAASGIAPRIRIGANRWFNLLWLLPIGFAGLITAIAAAKELRTMPAVQQFILQHPGAGFATHFATAMPAWLRVQHFLNLFFLLFIIRAGLQILADHPRLYWTRHSTPGREWLRVQKKVPDNPL